MGAFLDSSFSRHEFQEVEIPVKINHETIDGQGLSTTVVCCGTRYSNLTDE